MDILGLQMQMENYEIRDGTYTDSPFALYWLHYPYCLSFIRAEAAPPMRLLMIVSGVDFAVIYLQ